MMLSRWGFKPAGDNGTFFQKIASDVGGHRPQNPLGSAARAMPSATIFTASAASGTASGPVVFGKDGWFVKSKGIDAFAGVDVAGKIVVLYEPGFQPADNDPGPAGVTQDDLKGERGVDWADPMTYAKKKGAAAVIVIAPPQLQGNVGQLRNFLAAAACIPDKLRETPADNVPNTAGISCFRKSRRSRSLPGESGDKTRRRIRDQQRPQSSARPPRCRNLMDPERRRHLGRQRSGPQKRDGRHRCPLRPRRDEPERSGPDKIWNGADDDGSGTVGVLIIAEALAKERSGQSVRYFSSGTAARKKACGAASISTNSRPSISKRSSLSSTST